MANTLVIELGRPAWSVVRWYILGNRPFWFFVAFGALTTCILWPFYPDEAGLRDEWVGNVAVEGFGFLMDIVLFGLLWSVFDVYRERRAKIRGYQDELVDYIPWEGQEGVLRKVGIIKRLNELQASLPLLLRIHLEGAALSHANLEGAYLIRANLEGANLRSAILEGAYLQGANLKGAALWRANLEGAHLSGFNFEGAKDLTWDQLKEAKTNDETILPAYLKKDAPESYKGKFAGEEGEKE